jgi:hypothetical protein
VNERNTAPEVAAVAAAYRACFEVEVPGDEFTGTAWWRSAYAVEREIERQLSIAPCGGEDPECFGCLNCGVTGAYRIAAEAAEIGDHERAQCLQRLGDTWFHLTEAARQGGAEAVDLMVYGPDHWRLTERSACAEVSVEAER